MGAVIAYIIRLVGYALLVDAPLRIAQYYWENHGLDAVDTFRGPHDELTLAMTVAPFVLALFGFGRFRPVAVFVALYLAGVALTAPFALAKFVNAAG